MSWTPSINHRPPSSGDKTNTSQPNVQPRIKPGATKHPDSSATNTTRLQNKNSGSRVVADGPLKRLIQRRLLSPFSFLPIEDIGFPPCHLPVNLTLSRNNQQNHLRSSRRSCSPSKPNNDKLQKKKKAGAAFWKTHPVAKSEMRSAKYQQELFITVTYFHQAIDQNSTFCLIKLIPPRQFALRAAGDQVNRQLSEQVTNGSGSTGVDKQDQTSDPGAPPISVIDRSPDNAVNGQLSSQTLSLCVLMGRQKAEELHIDQPILTQSIDK
ncbi:hypothetical protein F2P81_016344 [Scophthalmus maximus]|uniref:Uncharacterized protein n=1 Tax=Scophthalmus maximus TaxID=52904 RepID=A0A6A4SH02_SCOMX|nr:hypothetical protein F2P81_016344 [Scophthalmus maximus]